MAAAISGSVAASVRQREGVSVVVASTSVVAVGRAQCATLTGAAVPFDFGDLIDAALVPAALEGGAEPERDDFVGEAEGDDAAAHGEHVGVVVLARHAGGVEIVAERGADAGDLVGGDLLALAAAADDDAAIGACRSATARATSAQIGG